MSNVACRQILEARLLNWANSRVPKLVAIGENNSVTPPETGIYLRYYLMPSMTDDMFLSGGHRQYIGVFQVSITDAVGTGPMPSLVIADQLDALFPSTLRLTSGDNVLVVTSPVQTGPLLEENSKSVLPIYFEYQMNKTL